MKRYAVAIAAATLVSVQAFAYCPTHDPLDPRCKMSDFSAPIGTVRWYLDNNFDRQATLIRCRSAFPPPRAWCDAAMQANRISTGAVNGKF
jgi:hypothetical protein